MKRRILPQAQFLVFASIVVLVTVVLHQTVNADPKNETYQFRTGQFGMWRVLTTEQNRIMVRFAASESPLASTRTVSSLQLAGWTCLYNAIEKHRFAVFIRQTDSSVSADRAALSDLDGVASVMPACRTAGGQQTFFLPDEVTIQFSDGISQSEVLAAIEDWNSQLVTKHWTPGYYTISLPEDKELFEWLTVLNADNRVAFAELNQISFDDAQYTPNDPLYSTQWPHSNTGQLGGTPGADTDMEAAWEIQTGDRSVILAIIDTGVEWKHEDLHQAIWTNPGEDLDSDGGLAWNGERWVIDPDDLNGIDDDGNGLIDDLIGWDFDDQDADPDDELYHGTAVAGVAAAGHDNGIGLSGVAGNVSILPIRVNLGSGLNAARADAINYAVSFADQCNGLVINLSWIMSSGEFSAVEAAIQNAIAAGATVVAASGNQDLDVVAFPAAYEGVIAVGGTSYCDQRASSLSCDDETWWGANYGAGLDIAAPSTAVPSTDISGAAGFGSGSYLMNFSGTSAAAPQVSGLMALLMSHYLQLQPGNTGLNGAELQEILQSTAEKVGGYDYDADPQRPGVSMELGYGRMNAAAALQELVNRYQSLNQPALDVDLTLRTAAGNGRIHYTTVTKNATDSLLDGDIWLVITAPDGSEDFILSGRQSIPPLTEFKKSRTYQLEGERAGEYKISLYSGVYPDSITDQSSKTYFKRLMEHQPEGTRASIGADIPDVVSLEQNYPNPFNPSTVIRYSLPVNSSVKLDIYNISGERIRKLVGGSSLQAANQPAGQQSVLWDGRNDAGEAVASGVYLYRMAAGEFVQTRRMLLVR